MQSDKFIIRPGETGTVLDRAERMAGCYGFSGKETLHIRLLAEEIITVLNPAFSLSHGRCWINTDKAAFSLTIDCDAGINGLDSEKKRQLLELNTVKDKKGIFGILGKALEYLIHTDVDADNLAGQHFFFTGGMESAMGGYSWNPVFIQSMPAVFTESEIKTEKEAGEEPELKIIGGIADDIKVSIERSQKGPRFQITVYKKFRPEQVSGIEF